MQHQRFQEEPFFRFSLVYGIFLEFPSGSVQACVPALKLHASVQTTQEQRQLKKRKTPKRVDGRRALLSTRVLYGMRFFLSIPSI